MLLRRILNIGFSNILCTRKITRIATFKFSNHSSLKTSDSNLKMEVNKKQPSRAENNMRSAIKMLQVEVRQRLLLLFSSQTTRIQLYQTLQIFPQFFTERYVNEFVCWQKNKGRMEKPSASRIKAAQNSLRILAKERVLPRIMWQKLNKNNTIILLEQYVNWLLQECVRFDRRRNNALVQLLDMRNPTKLIQTHHRNEGRVFIYHHGPTNSGKTSAAIKELSSLPPDKKGIYLAPLRLLAWQMQQKLGNCTLLTGQQREYSTSNLVSATIEMVTFDEEYEVAVVDEIQMIADMQRGFAWTKVVLGMRARRIHLCGDGRALNLITKIISPQDRIEECKYSRLSKLVLINKVFNLSQLQTGDCLVKMSIEGLKKVKAIVNKQSQSQFLLAETDTSESSQRIQNKNRTAMVYGKLPPSCRRNQTRAFNEGQLPYLVATSAIGMGLNLSINRIVFLSLKKTAKNDQTILSDTEIQQIAGRAGRGVVNGYVQCCRKRDLQIVRKALVDVNKTYGINLEDKLEDSESDERQNQQSLNEEISTQPASEKQFGESEKLLGQAETRVEMDEEKPDEVIYNERLGRFLNSKECSLRRAVIYFTYEFLYLIKVEVEWLIGRSVGLAETIKYFLTLAKQNNELYLFETKEVMVQWINILEPLGLSTFDQYNFAQSLCINGICSNSSNKRYQALFRKKLNFAKQFKEKKRVAIPNEERQIYERNFSDFVYLDNLIQLQEISGLLENYIYLGRKYELAFYEIDLAQDIKKACCDKIEQILANNLQKPIKKQTHGGDMF